MREDDGGLSGECRDGVDGGVGADSAAEAAGERG